MVGSGLDDNPDLETYTRAAGELGLTAALLDQVRDGADAQYRDVLVRFS
jgi:hypothetical protein